MSEFEILVSKPDMKFNCAHFVAFKGFRERLHGHNYQVAVKVIGTGKLRNDGYLIDFGDIKKSVRNICKSMNEFFICPMKSDIIQITEEGTQMCLVCEDGAQFSFPKTDCLQLPIVHATAEEMAHYLWIRIIRKIGLNCLLERNIHTLEVSVYEALGQGAIYRAKIPDTEEGVTEAEHMNIFAPSPCLDIDN